MNDSPRPGDPDFVPRYPPLDLAPIEQRIKERDAVANCAERARSTLDMGASADSRAMAIRADTDMMRELLREVRNLRLANAELKDVVESMRTRRV